MRLKLKLAVMKSILLVLLLAFAVVAPIEAATLYCGPAATGSGSGSDWNNVLGFDTLTLVRGNTYWIKGGTYARRTFPSTSGTSLIIVNKATPNNHGTSTGWNASYGTTQAEFVGGLTIEMSYLTIDGGYADSNTGPTIPSRTATYGILVSFTGKSSWSGVVSASNTSYVTLKGIHIYSLHRSKEGNYDIRNTRAVNSTYFACYNCFFDGSGQDGIVISGNHFLFDHCYVYDAGQRYAKGPDYHGQTIYGAGVTDAIVRWTIFENCEGQALWSNDDGVASRIRFYGNVVFNSSDNNYSGGFNSTGGILQTPASQGEGGVGIYAYNNTIVRQPGTNPDGKGKNYAIWVNYGSYSTDWYVYNNLEYACTNVGAFGTVRTGYWATGGGTNPAVPNQQTGITTSYFQNYNSYDFRLTQATSAGLNLTAQSWWSGWNDSFFGKVDYAVDMTGKTFGADGNWDRGAFEYDAGGG